MSIRMKSHSKRSRWPNVVGALLGCVARESRGDVVGGGGS
jgi:hypothetical protein